jgi:hypothetical protein
MLFDLRSRGRRRVIRVLYLFLAVLIGGGLVLFGVGGGASSTGVLSGLAQNGGGGSATGLKIDEAAVAKTERAAKAAPNSAAAWDAYATAAFQLASTGYVSGSTAATTGYDKFGAKELAVVAAAWSHYLSLSPAKPDQTLALDIANAFGGSPGIEEFATAETGQEIVAQDNPTSYEDYFDLAEYAYLAGETDRAQIAQAKTLKLAPKSQRATIKADFAEIIAEVTKASSTGASGTTGASG